MASQRLIVSKIGGHAAEFTLSRFRYWAAQRTVHDSQEWCGNQWPVAVRSEADEWFEMLRKNSLSPPVLFYAEYNDYWSFCPPCRFIREVDDDLLSVCANRYEGFCMELPLKDRVVESLKEVRRNGQWAEDRIFAWLTMHAASDWAELENGGVLVFLREVLAESIEDGDVIESLATVPKWMSAGSTGANIAARK